MRPENYMGSFKAQHQGKDKNTRGRESLIWRAAQSRFAQEIASVSPK
jgi:hypothetical protein